LKLWDPFCGSGTILLESLSLYLGLPVRTNQASELFDLQNVRAINKENHEKYLQNLSKVEGNSFLEESNIILLGNDIESEAIKSSLNNFDNLLKEHEFSEKYLDNNNNSFQIKENPVIFHHSFLGKRVHLFQTDFENIPSMINIKDFSILTNPPYGYRSRSHISFANLKGTYNRFKNLIRKNLRNLDQVYVLYPVDKKNVGSLIKTRGLAWNLIEKFDNGGIEIGLFQLDKEKTWALRQKDSSEIEVVNERMLMENKKKEESKAIQAFKESPVEKQKRREEKFTEEKKFLVEARQWSKKLKFPRDVTKNRTKLRRILHRKHQEYIRRKFYKKFVQARSLKEEKIKVAKADKSQNIRRKKGKALISSLLDDDEKQLNDEDLTRNLQMELKKKAEKIVKKKQEIKESKEKKPKNSKW